MAHRPKQPNPKGRRPERPHGHGTAGAGPDRAESPPGSFRKTLLAAAVALEAAWLAVLGVLAWMS